jgi:hypothetical protein
MKQTIATTIMATFAAIATMAIAQETPRLRFQTIPLNEEAYSDEDPLGVNAIKELQKDYITSFDVIACDNDKTVHSQLPEEEMYNKPSILDPNGVELVASTSTILGNGYRHSMVVRASCDETLEISNRIANCDIVVDWGDGTKQTSKDLYNLYYNPSTG